jgi:PAS domain S-box-containing protein
MPDDSSAPPEESLPGPSERRLPLWAMALLFGIGYFVCAEIGALLSFKPSRFEAFWPPSGLAIAVLLLSSRRHWPALLAAGFVASIAFNGSMGSPPLAVLAYAVINVIEPLVGATLIRRFVGWRPTLETVPDVTGLTFYSGFISTGISAFLGALTLTATSGAAFWSVLQAWWVANALGVLVVAPVVLTLGNGGVAALRDLSPNRRIEAIALTVGVVAVTWVVFANLSVWSEGDIYLVMPVLAAAAVLYGPCGSALAGCLASIVAVGTLGLSEVSIAPPTGVPIGTFGLEMQIFLAVALFTTMLLAAVLAERGRAIAERTTALGDVAKLAAESNRRAAELRGILDNMVDGVFVCDPEGRFTLVNDAGLRMIGRRDLLAAGLKLAETPDALRMRHPSGQPVSVDEIDMIRALRGETVVAAELVIANPRTGRDVVLRTSASPIRGETGEIIGAVAVAREVTGVVELDRLKDQFLGVAAHELKTPIAVMKGYAQLLQRSAPDLPATQAKMLDAIVRVADRIDRLVHDLLDVSRLQVRGLELAREPFDLAELTREVAAREAMLTSRHQITVSGAEHVVVSGDRDRIEQVVINLLDNAIRYSPAGGPIDVAIEVEPAVVAVSVRDQGVGIPADKQQHIFERFYRAHTRTAHDYGGMGIGLYISQEIVQRHGGRITFTSVEGQGSRFTFMLPRVQERDSERASA